MKEQCVEIGGQLRIFSKETKVNRFKKKLTYKNR